jgi:hypothetical protein
MRAADVRRIALALVTALAFGVAWSVAKGNAAGIRDAAGNVSAPWLILPLIGGALAARQRPVLGAAVGLTMTLLALGGFYLANAFVLDLGPHTTLQDVALTMHAVGDMWFRYGIVSGIGFGAAGSWLAGRRSLAAVGAIVATLLVCEPAAWMAWGALRGGGVSLSGIDPVVSAIELACGLALAATLRARRQSRG